jgi:hypothetical protein
VTESADNTNLEASPAAVKKPVVKSIKGWQLAALQPVGWLLKVWLRSLRVSASPEAVAALSIRDRARFIRVPVTEVLRSQIQACLTAMR